MVEVHHTPLWLQVGVPLGLTVLFRPCCRWLPLLDCVQQPDYGRQLTNVEGELQRLECDFQASWAALLGY